MTWRRSMGGLGAAAVRLSLLSIAGSVLTWTLAPTVIPTATVVVTSAAAIAALATSLGPGVDLASPGILNEAVCQGAAKAREFRDAAGQAASQHLIDVLQVPQKQRVALGFGKQPFPDLGADGAGVVTKLLALQQLVDDGVEDLFPFCACRLDDVGSALFDLCYDGVLVQGRFTKVLEILDGFLQHGFLPFSQVSRYEFDFCSGGPTVAHLGGTHDPFTGQLQLRDL